MVTLGKGKKKTYENGKQQSQEEILNICKGKFTWPLFLYIFWILLQNYELTYLYFGIIPVGAFVLLKFKQTRHIYIYWA